MGEFATYAGERIKIGTCEDMYYLRADQVELLSCSDIGNQWDQVRFRFPFPDEDGKRPGDFNDVNRSIPVWGVEPPAELEHSTIQFKANYPDRGILLSLPCPFSEDGKASSVRYQFNGFAGAVRIVQQRIWDGLLVLVAECGACGARYRYPTLEDVEPVLVTLRSQADRLQREADFRAQREDKPYTDGQVTWLHAIVHRIMAGYQVPPAWVQRYGGDR